MRRRHCLTSVALLPRSPYACLSPVVFEDRGCQIPRRCGVVLTTPSRGLSSRTKVVQRKGLIPLKKLVKTGDSSVLSPPRGLVVNFFSDIQRSTPEESFGSDVETVDDFSNAVRRALFEDVEAKKSSETGPSSASCAGEDGERSEPYYSAFSKSPLLYRLNENTALTRDEKQGIYEAIFFDERERCGLEVQAGLKLIEEAAGKGFDARKRLQSASTVERNGTSVAAGGSSLESILNERLRQRYIDSRKGELIAKESKFQQLEKQKKHPLMQMLTERFRSFRHIYPEYRSSTDHIVRTLQSFEDRTNKNYTLDAFLAKYAPITRRRIGASEEAKMLSTVTTGWLGERNEAIRGAELACPAGRETRFLREPEGKVVYVRRTSRSDRGLLTADEYRHTCLTPSPSKLWPEFFGDDKINTKEIREELARRTAAVVSGELRKCDENHKRQPSPRRLRLSYQATSSMKHSQDRRPVHQLAYGIASLLNRDLRIREAEHLLHRSARDPKAEKKLRALRTRAISDFRSHCGAGDESLDKRDRRVLSPHVVRELIANKKLLGAQCQANLAALRKLPKPTLEDRFEARRNRRLYEFVNASHHGRVAHSRKGLPRHAIELLVKKGLAPDSWLARYRRKAPISRTRTNFRAMPEFLNLPGVPELYMVNDDAAVFWLPSALLGISTAHRDDPRKHAPI